MNDKKDFFEAALALNALLFMFIGLPMLLVLPSVKSANNQATSMYQKEISKPYLTTTGAHKIVKKANMANYDTSHAILKKLNNKTVVDNQNGYEYTIHINISDDSDRDSTYSLTPKISRKSAIINKTWQKEHNKS